MTAEGAADGPGGDASGSDPGLGGRQTTAAGPERPVRIAFFGTPTPAVPSLRALLASERVDVTVVVTNPDRPAGRGHKLTAPPVKEAGLRAGVEVLQPERVSDIAEDLAALNLDACAVVAYGLILPQPVLETGGRGFVNLHFSLLPAWRGAAPVAASILAGDTTTGVTCFRLDAGMDTGDILRRQETPVAPAETSGELTERLARVGADVLVESVVGLARQTITPTAQDHDKASYAPKISTDQAKIDWSASATLIDRQVRAYNPMPGAHTTLKDVRLKIHRVVPVEASGPAGKVVDHHEGAPVVACGTAGVRLEEVQPAGKPRMSGADFANGYHPTAFGS